MEKKMTCGVGPTCSASSPVLSRREGDIGISKSEMHFWPCGCAYVCVSSITVVRREWCCHIRRQSCPDKSLALHPQETSWPPTRPSSTVDTLKFYDFL